MSTPFSPTGLGGISVNFGNINAELNSQLQAQPKPQAHDYSEKPMSGTEYSQQQGMSSGILGGALGLANFTQTTKPAKAAKEPKARTTKSKAVSKNAAPVVNNEANDYTFRGNASRGENSEKADVFTPDFIVLRMLKLVLPELETWENGGTFTTTQLSELIDKTFFEPTAGDGNFLIRILDYKLRACYELGKINHGDTYKLKFEDAVRCLNSMYMIELDDKHYINACLRLLDVIEQGTTCTMDGGILKGYMFGICNGIGSLSLNQELEIRLILAEHFVKGNTLELCKNGKTPWDDENDTIEDDEFVDITQSTPTKQAQNTEPEVEQDNNNEQETLIEEDDDELDYSDDELMDELDYEEVDEQTYQELTDGQLHSKGEQ